MTEVCPVDGCGKSFKNKKALAGHIFLTKDAAHKNYYDDHIARKKISLLPIPAEQENNSVDLKSMLNNFIRDKTENNELVASIKKLLEDDNTRLENLEVKLEDEYESFKTNYTAEKNREYNKYKTVLDKEYNAKHNGLQTSVNAALEKGRNEQTVWIQDLPIYLNTETGRLFLRFLDQLNIIFPSRAEESFKSCFINNLLQQNYACNNEIIRLNDELHQKDDELHWRDKRESLRPLRPTVQAVEQLEQRLHSLH